MYLSPRKKHICGSHVAHVKWKNACKHFLPSALLPSRHHFAVDSEVEEHEHRNDDNVDDNVDDNFADNVDNNVDDNVDDNVDNFGRSWVLADVKSVNH